MITSATRSRAAVLCFGGWGLQLMLHLSPRLRAAQEQRDARSVGGADLTRITSFATLLPDAVLDAEGDPNIHLLRMRADEGLPPFYLERLLAQIERQQRWAHTSGPDGHSRPNGNRWATNPSGGYSGNRLAGAPTQSERCAQALLQAAEPVLESLQWRRSRAEFGVRANRGAASQPSVRRADVFRSGLRHGPDIARLLEAHLVDPIRQDNLVPGDPFVQTTLYVVAPLYEPLAAALLWPILAQLLDYVGRRHISQVVGVFATGSYATDSSRIQENASSYASLTELEVLTGLRSDNDNGLAALVGGAGSRPVSGRWGPLSRWIGAPIFDRIYLVDREKSNQGLAQDSYELTALVGNAMEAMIAADGSQYIEEQLGIDLRNAQERPYSLLGAATDFVPLNYIFQAVHQQEEKRLVRELVLTRESEAPSPSPETPSLGNAGDEPGGSAQASLVELGVTPEQILAQLVLRLPDLFLDVTPAQVSDLEVHPDFVLPPVISAEMRDLTPPEWRMAFDERLQEVTRHFSVIAGSDALDEAWGLQALDADGLPRTPGDDRLLPGIASQMREFLVDQIAGSPSGMSQARAQLRRWLDEIEAGRQALQTSTPPGKQHLTQAQRQLALRSWRTRYSQAMADNPSLSGAVLRPTLLLLVILALSLGYLLAFNRPWDFIVDGGTFMGIGLGAYAASLMAYRRRLSRLQTLRRQRLALAQQELTAQLQERARRGLGRVYDHLAQMLRQMAHTLDETIDDLQTWSVAEGPPPLPPAESVSTHLTRPHLSEDLWERCRAYLRGQQDTQGRHSAERLQELWGTLQWRQTLEQLLVTPPAEQPLARSLQELVRETVQRAVAPVGVGSLNPARAELVRKLAGEQNIEHLLWRNASLAHQHHPLVRRSGNSRVPVRTKGAIHRYLEFLWSNAKPSANYDVADRLATHGIHVDFAAVSGDADSDLTQMVLQDFRVARLLTNDPFRITFVRTVHGLNLDDLESVHHYRAELSRLSSEEEAQILLMNEDEGDIYDADAENVSLQQMWT